MKVKKSEIEALKEIKEFYAVIKFNGITIGDARIKRIEAGGYTKGKIKLALMPIIEFEGDLDDKIKLELRDKTLSQRNKR